MGIVKTIEGSIMWINDNKHMNDLIKERVNVRPKPAVLISGGIDSAIILHHVCEKHEQTIWTYTANFGVETDECKKARLLARKYGTNHHEIQVKNVIKRMPEVLAHFDHAVYNIWPWWLVEAAAEHGRKTLFIGEGGDELFGGYNDREYNESIVGREGFAMFTYDTCCRHFGIILEAPFRDIPYDDAKPFRCPQYKRKLREAYSGILPDEIVYQAGEAPRFTNYRQMWETELKKHHPGKNPQSVDEIKAILQMEAHKAWLVTREK